MTSAASHPDLPEWLHFIQRDMSQGAFLYGQPKSLDDASQIQVKTRIVYLLRGDDTNTDIDNLRKIVTQFRIVFVYVLELSFYHIQLRGNP